MLRIKLIYDLLLAERFDMETTKMSVYIPRDLHRQLKQQALDTFSSLRTVVIEKLSPVSKLATENRKKLSRKEVLRFKKQLEELLESGDPIIINNCVTSITIGMALLMVKNTAPIEMVDHATEKPEVS